MADAFSITTASGTIELDASRHGSASFSVTNVSGRAIRARAEVVAEGVAADLVAVGAGSTAGDATAPPSPAAAWFAIAGEAERSFPIGGTEVYRVDVTVPATAAPPPTAPPRKYRFRLDVLGTADPDEDQAQGQWVGFTVSPQPASARKVPWLWVIVAAAAVVILAAAGVTAWVLTHRQSTLTPSASTVNFGAVAVSGTATQAVTVKNTGPVGTTVNATVSGANAADFSVGQAACLGHTLSPKASCVIQVAFKPAKLGNDVAALQITGDHAASKTVALTGTGGAPTATASPFNLTFFLNDSGRNWSGTTTVTNTGNTPLQVTSASVSLSTAPAGPFNVVVGNFCSHPVAPNQSCIITVTIKVSNLVSGSSPPPTGTLTITSDAPPLRVHFG